LSKMSVQRPSKTWRALLLPPHFTPS
jgi:hypothetical protein